jgi:hypothetical protein
MVARARLLDLLFTHLTEIRRLDPAMVAALWRDYQRGGRSDLPDRLRPTSIPADAWFAKPSRSRRGFPRPAA